MPTIPVQTVLNPKVVGQFTIPTTSALDIEVTETSAITVKGCKVGDILIANFPDMTANILPDAYISGTNAVKVRLCNPTAGDISVTGKKINLVVI